MQYSLIFFIHLALLFQFLGGCKSTKPNTDDTTPRYHFLDKTEGGNVITQDAAEGFFDNIEVLDIAIQLGKDCGNKTQCLDLYKAQLKDEVIPFTTEDQVVMTSVLDSALYLVYQLNPKILNQEIDLIKIKGLHYGPSVYYTRANSIVIPQDALENPSFTNLLSVMLHEIAHIVSRYQPRFKKEIYPLIGFEKRKSNVIIPDAVKNRMLLNPDGLNLDYTIILDNGGESIEAIPLIISNVSSIKNNKDGFFSYLKFDLYDIKNNEVQCKENGFSSMDPSYMVSFFNQIKDNTQYIIHPDEILADNFMHLVMEKGQPSQNKFSEEGLILLDQIKKVLVSIN